MAKQKEELVTLVVKARGNGKAHGVVFEGVVYKIGEKFSAPKNDANYLKATGKCEDAKAAPSAEAKK